MLYPMGQLDQGLKVITFVYLQFQIRQQGDLGGH